MAIKTLSQRTALGTVLAKIGYPRGRLNAHPLGVPYVPLFVQLRAKWSIINDKELSLREAITDAQALVDHVDEELNLFARKLMKEVDLVTGEDHDHLLYKHFFGNKTLSEFVRPVLSRKLESMRKWLPSLQGNEHPPLAALAPELSDLIKQADAASDARTAAEQARDQFRDLGERYAFIEEVNATRKEVYGALSKLPHEKTSLPTDFADGFFRRAGGTAEEEEEPTIDSVDEAIAELEEQLAEQKALRDDLVKAEEARKAAEEEAARKREALAALEKQQKELSAQADAMRAELSGKPAKKTRKPRKTSPRKPSKK